MGWKGKQCFIRLNGGSWQSFFCFACPIQCSHLQTLSSTHPLTYQLPQFSRALLQMLPREVKSQNQYLVNWYSLKFGIGVNEWSRFLMIWCIGKFTSIEQWTSWVEKMAASLQVHRILDVIWYTRDKVYPRWLSVDRQDFYVCIHSLLSRLPMGQKYWSEFDACR